MSVTKQEDKKTESGHKRKSKPKTPISESIIDRDIEREVGISIDELANLYVLESIKGFGPQKFKELHSYNIGIEKILSNSNELLRFGKRGELFRLELDKTLKTQYRDFRQRAVNQIYSAHKYKAVILTYDHPYYPKNVYLSNNPIPVLYIRGSLEAAKEVNTVACVGSRNIRAPYSSLLEEFTKTACLKNFTVVSGFALGADRIGHETALRTHGKTVCVMPGGLERPFPPENKDLWNELLTYDRAALVSEFPFGIRTSALTLRKRNKLIVAFSRGVVIGQSSAKGGAMNAYRFSREQHKPVATFVEDGNEDTSGNKLIGEYLELGDCLFPTEANLSVFEKWVQGLYFSI